MITAMLPAVFETLLVAGQGSGARRAERAAARIGIDLAAGDDACTPEAVLASAERTGSQAVYVAESMTPREWAAFASRVRDGGLTVVAPAQATLEHLCDIAAQRVLVAAAGLGVLPWRGAFSSFDSNVATCAADIGFPLRCRGVANPLSQSGFTADDEDTLAEAFAAALEAAVAAGDGRVILEADLHAARRLEVTVMVDQKGRAATFPERESSLRGGTQTWITESPSPLFSLIRHGDEHQTALAGSAIEIAQALELSGMITLTFLVDTRGQTVFFGARAGCPDARLLIEMTTDHDPVELELRLAAGEAVPFEGAKPATGHGFESRLWAASADKAIEHTRFPPIAIRKARAELAHEPGETPSSPLIATVATLAPIRHQALLQLDRFLAESEVGPGPHTLESVRRCLNHESFRAGQYDLAFTRRMGLED